MHGDGLPARPRPAPSPCDFLELTTPALRSDSGVISLSPRSASRSRFTTAYSFLKMLVKPRLGRRRCSGIWPPSKPRMMREPLRDRWPLCPRVEVLPMPEPIPRPTRLRFSVAFRGARKLTKIHSYVPVLACHSLVAQSPLVPPTDNLHYFTISTRCGTLATMPRIEGVSSRSITWFSRVKPRPLTTSLCFTGAADSRTNPLQVHLCARLGLCRFLSSFVCAP